MAHKLTLKKKNWKFPHSLIAINVFLLILSFVLGRWLYRDALIWGDSLLLFLPFDPSSPPRAHFPVLSVFRSAFGWYCQINGRLSQALIGGLIRAYSSMAVPTPELFPAWIMRSGSLFCMIATPINFLGLMRRLGVPWGNVGVAGGVLFSVWVTNPLIYVHSMWIELSFVQYYLPAYLISIFALVPLSRLGYFHAGLYLFLSLCTEHYLLSVPILFLAFSAIVDGEKSLAPFLKKRLLCYFFLSFIAGSIYYFSPGQRGRSVLLDAKAPSLSVVSWLNWYQQSVSVGYEGLFFKSFNPGLFTVLHTILFSLVLLMLFIASRSLLEPAENAPQNTGSRKNRFNFSLLSFAFLASYLACLSTLLVSPYFPFYYLSIPCLYLVLGIIFAALAASEFLKPLPHRISPKYFLRLVWVAQGAAMILLFYFIFPKWPQLQSHYVEAIQHSRVRRWLYEEIRNQHCSTLNTNFILTNFPQNSFEFLIEPPWGFRGYFLWWHLPELRVFVKDGVDDGSIPKGINYSLIDYSSSPWKIPTLRMALPSKTGQVTRKVSY